MGVDLAPLRAAGAWDTLGAVVVALDLAWSGPVHDLALAEDLAHDLTLGPAVATDLAPYALGEWHAAAVGCPTGWAGVLGGACPATPGEEPAPEPLAR
jgi:hypothetical protein